MLCCVFFCFFSSFHGAVDCRHRGVGDYGIAIYVLWTDPDLAVFDVVVIIFLSLRQVFAFLPCFGRRYKGVVF